LPRIKNIEKKVVGLPDIHCPDHDDQAIDVALELVEYLKPQILFIMGDFMAVESLTRYPPSNWRAVYTRFNEEVAIANPLLDKIDKIAKKLKIKEKYYLEGNHEFRLNSWLYTVGAKLGDMRELSIPYQLKLGSRGWNYVTQKEQPVIIGKACYQHESYINNYHANKTVQETGRNVFYVHTHDHQVMYGKRMPGDRLHKAASWGCLCKLTPSYDKQPLPNRWIHGIGVVEYMDEGCFTDYFLPIIDYKCAFDGWVFHG